MEIGELVTYGDIFGTVIGKAPYDGIILDTLPNKPISVKDLRIVSSNYFRKGAYVRIREDLKHGYSYGRLHFYDTGNIKGTIHKVTKISKNGTYYLDGIDGQTFSLDMLIRPFIKGDVVIVDQEGLVKYGLVGAYIVEQVRSEDNFCLLCGVYVSPRHLIKSETIAIDYVAGTTNILKEDNYENQLQRKGSVVSRGQRPEGSRIYGRRPKAAVSIGSLSNKARLGYSKG